MKTQEEIEQLADNRYLQKAEDINDSEIRGYILSATKGGFVDGYTQCQEDMKKDIEYWQGEFDHWHQQAIEMADKYNALLNKQD